MRKLLKAKLCCRYLIKRINTLAVPFVRYSELFLSGETKKNGQKDEEIDEKIQGLVLKR